MIRSRTFSRAALTPAYSNNFSRRPVVRRPRSTAPRGNIIREVVQFVPSRQNNRASVGNAKKKTVAGFDLNMVFSDIFSSFRSTVSKPEVLMLLVFVFTVVVALYKDFEKSVVGQWANENKTNNNFAMWLIKNYMKFFGMLIFLPTVFDLPRHMRVWAVILAVVWCYVVPEHTIFEYVIQSICIHTFFKVRNANSRIFLVMVVIFCWLAGYTFLKNNVNNKSRRFTDDLPLNLTTT